MLSLSARMFGVLKMKCTALPSQCFKYDVRYYLLIVYVRVGILLSNRRQSTASLPDLPTVPSANEVKSLAVFLSLNQILKHDNNYVDAIEEVRIIKETISYVCIICEPQTGFAYVIRLVKIYFSWENTMITTAMVPM